MPDDGEWECIDLSGAVRCHGGEPASAVVAGPPEAGWLCGPRAQGPRGPEKLCVDFAPDFPPSPGPWQCRFDHQHGEKRICKAATTTGLGDHCPCPDGASC